jgi:hypothetical protein
MVRFKNGDSAITHICCYANALFGNHIDCRRIANGVGLSTEAAKLRFNRSRSTAHFDEIAEVEAAR